MKKSMLILMIAAVSMMSFLNTQAAEPALKVGDPAPKLACGDFVQGDRCTEFEKGKVYVVEFWATWCGPCTSSIPHLNGLWKKYQDKGLVVIGQNVWEQDESGVEKFIERMGEKMTYRVALDDKSTDTKGAMATTWMAAAGQDGIPTAFVVDKEGKIAWIGHPTGLDKVLEAVLAGTFDSKKFAETDTAADEAVFEKGRKLISAMEGKKWDEALAILDDLAKLLPDEKPIAYWRNRVEVLIHKDLDAVRKLVTQLAEYFKDDADGLAELAYQLVWDEEAKPLLPLAEKIAARANKLAKGEDPITLDILARVIFMKGDKNKAIELQKQAVSLAETTFPSNPNYELMKDELKNTLKSYEKGILPYSAGEEDEPAEAPEDEEMDAEIEKQAARSGIPVKIGDTIPDWSAPDTNPSSPTFGKTVSTKDFKGTASFWIITFDCDS